MCEYILREAHDPGDGWDESGTLQEVLGSFNGLVSVEKSRWSKN